MRKQAVSYEILLTHFFNVCDDSFGFMCGQYGFKKYTGIVEFHKGRKIIKPSKDIKNLQPFLAICRLEMGDIAIEISYGGDDFIIDSHVYYDFINRFSMMDIVSAAKKMDTRLNEQYAVTSEHLITEKIKNIARCLESYPHLFTEINDKLISRALKIRSKRMEQSVREQYKRNMSQAIERGAKAFRAKDYRKVVQLFKPFENSLQASDKKKYARAIEQLTNTHKT